jgi:hypothetical protein
MNQPGLFELVLLRPIRIEGRLFVTGARLHADATAAHDWILSGRARLAHDRDLATLIKIVGTARPAPVAR